MSGEPPPEPAAAAVDPIACTAYGMCAELFPEGVVLDDWGYPLLLGPEVPPAQLAHARRAVKTCPTLALQLTQDTDQ